MGKGTGEGMRESYGFGNFFEAKQSKKGKH